MLSNPNLEIDTTRVSYLNNSKEIYINALDISSIEKIEIINLIGQSIASWEAQEFVTSSHEIRIPAHKIADGAYIIKVFKAASTLNKKVVIKH